MPVNAIATGRAQHAAMIDTIEGWRCIGCGKVDAPRPCIGVCTDKRVELVLAEDYAALALRVEQLEDALALRVEQLEEALALIARTTPKPERLADSWAALQTRAKRLLDEAQPLY